VIFLGDGVVVDTSGPLDQPDDLLDASTHSRRRACPPTGVDNHRQVGLTKTCQRVPRCC
jgi:hypothetical protein